MTTPLEGWTIGICPECGQSEGGELAIKWLRSGTRYLGCRQYSDCEYSLPLPRRGDIVVTDEFCEEHDLPEIEVHDDDDDDEPWELGCPICNYLEYRAGEDFTVLEDLDGVDAAMADELRDAGLEDPSDILPIDAATVAAEIEDLSVMQVREWQIFLPN